MWARASILETSNRVVCGNPAHRLRGLSMVVIQDTSEPFSVVDITVHVRLVARLLD
jgi:hypothetical protein